MERLQKVIANSGYTSRRKAEELISKGKVYVNGQKVTELGTKVNYEDTIVVEGHVINKEVPKEYYLLLKKAEYLGRFDTQLLPVPTSESLKSNPGELSLSSVDLQNFINNHTTYAN